MDKAVVGIVKALEGLSLWGATRAADMEMLDFGDRFTREFRTGPRTVGEYALHLQSAWRITSDGRVVVGARDHWWPRSGVVDVDFDPDNLGSTRRDELIVAFLAHGESAHRVKAAAIDDHPDLRLAFADGCELEVWADIGGRKVQGEEAPAECWRLFRCAVAGEPHLVCWAGGKTTLS